MIKNFNNFYPGTFVWLKDNLLRFFFYINWERLEKIDVWKKNLHVNFIVLKYCLLAYDTLQLHSLNFIQWTTVILKNFTGLKKKKK